MTDAGVVSRGADPGHLEIALSGEIDLQNAGAVERQLNDLVSNTTESVTIDLTRLTYLDSAGLRVMFGLASRLELLQVRLELRVPPGSVVRRAVEVSGLGEVVAID
ncbi:MAG: anti-sigma factor antagonist [Pseudonocardiaceae bacterium]|nr:MAG: anti-sigma factor antagonist [Pseudonocardiaceae bacterium]